MNIKWPKINFIAAIVGARVSMGLFSNITSPTLPTLAQNCNVSIATVSWIFTVRSIASFVGAAGVHSGLFHEHWLFANQKTPRFETLKAFKLINPTLILSFSLALAAVCLSCVPLGWFSKRFLCCCASRKQFSGNRYGSLISGCYVCLYWYLVLRKELSLVDYNQ